MVLRVSKVLLTFALAFYYLLVVATNVSDYNINYQFVHHVMAMDTVFPGNLELWRAITNPFLQRILYDSIIAWEFLTFLLLTVGGVLLLRRLRAPAASFDRAKQVAVGGLTLSLLMWLTAFLSVGAEWFLMWQSKSWNGQEAAGRMFNVVGITLIFIALPEYETVI